MPAEDRPAFEDLPALQDGMEVREAAAETAGIDLVEPLAHPGVRGRLPHAEERGKVPRLDWVFAAAHLRVELQQSRHLEREHREPGHQAVAQAEVACLDRVGDAVEACAHLVEHPGHRQMLSEGVSGHVAARLLPVSQQYGRSGAKSL